MAFNTQVVSDFTNQVNLYLERRFLEMIKAELHLASLGMPKSLAKREGNTMRFFRWDTPTGNAAALTDGVTPSGTTRTTSTVLATLVQYGLFTAVSDALQTIVINDTLRDITDLNAYDAALSIDSLVRTELRTNGTQKYADGAFVGGANASQANVETGTDRIRSNELRGIAAALRVANSRPYADGFYRGVVNPLQEIDLYAETAANSFVILASHNGTASAILEKGFIGTAYGIKLMRSTNITVGTSANTFGAIFCGMNGFGTIGIETLKPEVIVKPLGFGEDPLNQRASAGYKYWYAAKVLRALDVQVLWSYSV
ncbi:MAG: N4-gp56 family major capsid protein [Nitrososphaerales archaeon]